MRRSRPPKPNTATCGRRTPWRWIPTQPPRPPPSKLTPYTEPPPTTNDAGTAAQSAAVAQAAATPAGSVLKQPTATAYTGLAVAAMAGQSEHRLHQHPQWPTERLFGSSGASTYSALFSAVKAPLGFATQFNDIGLLTNFPVSQFLKFSPSPGFGLPPKAGLGGGLLGPWYGRGWLTGSVSASMGDTGTLVGKLSVPPAWAAATPTIRTAAAALSAAGTEAVPAAALGEVGLFSSMSMAGMLGSAIGAGAPTVASRQRRSRPYHAAERAEGFQRQALSGATQTDGRTDFGEARKRAASPRRSRGAGQSARATGQGARGPCRTSYPRVAWRKSCRLNINSAVRQRL